MRINELEVTSHWEHDVVCSEMLAQVGNIVNEPFGLPVCVELCAIGVNNKGSLIRVGVEEVEVSWGIVGISNHHEGEELGSLSEMVPLRSPEPLHTRLVHPLLGILIISSCKDHSVEAHFSEETGID